jgi:hypothetical protein
MATTVEAQIIPVAMKRKADIVTCRITYTPTERKATMNEILGEKPPCYSLMGVEANLVGEVHAGRGDDQRGHDDDPEPVGVLAIVGDARIVHVAVRSGGSLLAVHCRERATRNFQVEEESLTHHVTPAVMPTTGT